MKLKPYMPQYEIAVLDAVFALKRPQHVLEFGAGGSTVRYSSFPSVTKWVSIETESRWAELARFDADNADIHLVNEDSFDSYTVPASGHYDLIFIDGKFRVRCVQESPRWLAKNGVVILHDALRPEYAEAWSAYPHKVLLGSGDMLHNGLLLLWEAPA